MTNVRICRRPRGPVDERLLGYAGPPVQRNPVPVRHSSSSELDLDAWRASLALESATKTLAAIQREQVP